jgi:hypothetical protein
LTYVKSEAAKARVRLKKQEKRLRLERAAEKARLAEIRSTLSEREAMLLDALIEARDHLNFCNYGDSWESECAYDNGLPERIEKAIKAAGGE